ncbi:MAG: hypothetical protein JWO81_3460 [Alphaproteobacteria bacterium]|nr:hypothetical protein [Alphaproteobacteria bacterium]
MPTAAEYIIKRLEEQGVEALFGIPAVYCSEVFMAAKAGGFRVVVTVSDLEAGYAADAYARIKGLGAVSVAYGVGTHSLVNAIAGAFVERSPVVVINGGPAESDVALQSKDGILFSHSMGASHSDLQTFRQFTAFCERVTNVANIPAMVDRALVSAITRKRPSYLEIPQHLLKATVPAPAGALNLAIQPGAATAAATEILAKIHGAKFPLMIVGEEIQRYQLGAKLLAVIDKLGISWMTTLVAKSVLPESHPKFLDVFNGERASAKVRKALAGADFIISLGAVFGSGHASVVRPKLPQMIRVWNGELLRDQAPPIKVSISHLIDALGQQALTDRGDAAEDARELADANQQEWSDEMLAELFAGDVGEAAWDGDPDALTQAPAGSGRPAPVAAGLTYDELFQVIAEPAFLDAAVRIIVDTLLGVYPAANLKMPSQNSFLVGGLWASIGHSVGAAVGAAIPGDKRPVVICGDGGFQVTAQALSTMARHKHPAIVIVVDNGLYGYEQFLLNNTYYSDPAAPPISYAVIPHWDYVSFATALGVPLALNAHTVPALRAALMQAKANNGGPSLIRAVVQSKSLPAELH